MFCPPAWTVAIHRHQLLFIVLLQRRSGIFVEKQDLWNREHRNPRTTVQLREAWLVAIKLPTPSPLTCMSRCLLSSERIFSQVCLQIATKVDVCALPQHRHEFYMFSKLTTRITQQYPVDSANLTEDNMLLHKQSHL